MGKRLGTQRRGRGGSLYRSPSHRHIGSVKHPKFEEDTGTIEDIVHSPGHSVPVAKVKYGSGKKDLMLAPVGLQIGQEVYVGNRIDLKPGNTLPLELIPEGTPVYNIEINPKDGGKLARAGGTAAYIVSHGKRTMVRLPSGSFKSLNPQCRATIGILASGGHDEKPFAKSGKKFHAYRSKGKKYLKVKGVSMNAANHPHGGGNHPHVGGPSTVSRNAPPGKKVGRLSPQKRKGHKRKKR